MKRFSLISVKGQEFTKAVMDVALGKENADLAIVNATLMNVYTGEYQEHCAVAVKGEWIAYVGDDPEPSIGPETKIIDAREKVLAPGLIDGHSHLADYQYNPTEFLRHAMTGGTTTIITETIEPYPVLGCKGIEEFLDALADQPIRIFGTVPPMASTSKEVHGISSDALERLLAREDVLGLGESYWQAVLLETEKFLPIFEKTLQSGKQLEGHSAGAKGRKLMAYLSPGISSCHEPINGEEALERLRLGIRVMVREGGMRRDLAAISKLKDQGIDLRGLILVTDGVLGQDLMDTGYMEDVVKKAIECGFDPMTAIQMATINGAEYFRLDGILGGIAPGKYADMILLPDPHTIKAEWVISKGKMIARQGELLVPPRDHIFSAESLNSVHLKRDIIPSDFAIPVENDSGEISVRVIDQVTELVTREFITSVPVQGGAIGQDVPRDILKVAAIDRRFSPGKKFVGLIRGFKLGRGALASSGAWDTSNIIVVGENDDDMAGAVNRIHELQGGAVLYAEGRVLVEIPLPLFGLMSDLPLPELVTKTDALAKEMKGLGFPFDEPLRPLMTLTGAAIPFLRISEEGLIDIKTGEILDLFVKTTR
ncbi:adenine deaminase C-terminal domain-containing protein [Thermodesulfobacteriota bacterium]